MERWDVIVVGSGPAGAATALRLAQRAPAVAVRTLLIEKARHPREKTCAGGVIPHALDVLADLGVPFAVPHARVDRAWVGVPSGAVEVDGDDLCRVVRRNEFDAALAGAARDRGVTLQEDTHVTSVERFDDGIRVETSRGAHWAPVVVGADGSGSRVRRALVSDAEGLVGKGVMTDLPIDATSWDGQGRGRYDFDFAPLRSGVRGYRWTFPCVIDDCPHVNVGAYALPPVDGAALRRELAAEVERIGGRVATWKAFPIRGFVPGAPVAASRVVLVGDAAGVEPLLGEGISYALEYGVLAADAILEARATGDWSFRDYERAVHRGSIGRRLRFLGLAARVFYGRWSAPAFAVLGRAPALQRLGLDWYNGSGRFRRHAA